MTPELVTPLRFDLAGLARDGRLGDHQSLMRFAVRADRYGFGGIWFNEFHFHRSTLPYPHTLLLGAEILARTEHLRFGTSVLVLPLHHPLMLAEQIAQLDFQSGGRVDVGVGRGTEPATFETLGIDQTSARQRFEEALTVMLQAWTSERVASVGPTWPFAETEVGPPPAQTPHPPIHVAGVSAETVAIAAGHRFPLLLSLEPNEARQLPVFRDALRRVGAGSGPLAASSLARYVLPAATPARAEAALDRLTDSLNRRRAARAAARAQVPPRPRDRAEMLADYAIAGTPEECHRQILDLVSRTGCRNLRCLFDANGLIPLSEASSAMDLFATEVLPALKGRTVSETPDIHLERT